MRGPAKCTGRAMICPPGHSSPPARKRAHNSHTGAVKIGFIRGLRGVLLIEGIQLPRTGTYSISIGNVKSACSKVFPWA